MSTYFAIGLMSGTSLDGLDICYVKFSKSENWSFEILSAETISYDETWKLKLQNASQISAEDLLALDKELGFFLGEKTQEFISKNNIINIDVIASHGHTVFHQPQRKFTLQIGDGRAIKIMTNKTVVYDFRSQDVLLGGNGAPLVPIGDELLFSEFDACLNLGGFSNISLKKNQERIDAQNALLAEAKAAEEAANAPAEEVAETAEEVVAETTEETPAAEAEGTEEAQA